MARLREFCGIRKKKASFIEAQYKKSFMCPANEKQLFHMYKSLDRRMSNEQGA